MNVNFNKNLIQGYHSKSQIARILTEDWVEHNMYCPRCENQHIQKFKNNQPVADFFCPLCHSQFELKSKNGNIGKKIIGGSYKTMINRILSNSNPDFFLMTYSMDDLKVNNFIFIPKHFFTPDIIEKRKPLSPNARRAGWIGCNILINKIPKQGKIPIISNTSILNYPTIISSIKKSCNLIIKNINRRGWLFDVLTCINMIPMKIFELKDVYAFDNILKEKHQGNINIHPKIRQQLQLLRNNGIISFLGNGKYIKN